MQKNEKMSEAQLHKHIQTLNGACERNRDLVFELYKEGMSLTKIGRRIGTSRRMVKLFLRRNGVTEKFPYAWKKERSNRWNGGRIVDKNGYVLVYHPGHPNPRNSVYVLEHRLVMEQHLGRYLDPKEVVHHRNKDKTDNRIENLVLFARNGLHLKHELDGKRPNWTDEGWARMQAAVHRVGDQRRGKSPYLWPKRGAPQSPEKNDQTLSQL